MELSTIREIKIRFGKHKKLQATSQWITTALEHWTTIKRWTTDAIERKFY